MRRWALLGAGTALLCLACGNLTGGGDPPKIDYQPPGATADVVDEPTLPGPCCCQVSEGTWEQLDACSSRVCVDDSYCQEAEVEPDEVDEPEEHVPTIHSSSEKSSGSTVGGHMTRPTGSSSTGGTMTRPGGRKSSSSGSKSSSGSSSSGTMTRPTR